MIYSDFEDTKDLRRTILRTGIHYKGCKYWHSTLATLIGQTVHIVPTSAMDLPESVEVFDDGRRICIASRVQTE